MAKMLVKVEVDVLVELAFSGTNRHSVEVLALAASSHNECDPDRSSVLDKMYGSAEVTHQRVISMEEVPGA